jgi:hypothetical protein
MFFQFFYVLLTVFYTSASSWCVRFESPCIWLSFLLLTGESRLALFLGAGKVKSQVLSSEKKKGRK